VHDPLTAARVRFHVGELLRDRVLLSVEALTEALAGRGIDLGPDAAALVAGIVDEMTSAPPLSWIVVLDTPGEGDLEMVADLMGLADGVTWTVPIADLDRETDTLPIASLGLLYDLVAEGELRLDTGEPLVRDHGRRRASGASEDPDDDDAASGGVGWAALALPTGWLAAKGLAAGDHLALTVRNGILEADPATHVPEAAEPLVALLRDAAIANAPTDAEGDPVGPAPAGPTLATVLASIENRSGLVLPPLGPWAEVAGLSRRNAQLAPAGFDFDLWAEDARISFVARAHRFDDDERDAFTVASLARLAWQAGSLADHPDLAAAAGAALGDAEVARAFLDEELGTRLLPEELVQFLGVLLEHEEGPNRPAGVPWLLAEIASVAGDLVEQESWLDIALDNDPTFDPAIHDKAWFAFDRGDGPTALRYLRRLDPQDAEPDLGILDGLFRPARASVGRNEPCPCGSGRKYKHCHLDRPAAPSLTDRLTWLYRKAGWWLERRCESQLFDIQWARAGGFGGDLVSAMNDPLVADLALVEDGLLADWLDQRGSLLPDDEALLAAQWSLVGRSLFEVTEVRAGVGLTLRDLRTGDVVAVDERSGSHGMRVGRYLLARPLPTGGDRFQLFGGITVIPDSARDQCIDLLDADPRGVEVASFLAHLESGPSFVNYEGHDTVMCELVWRVEDPVSAAVALDDAFGEREPADDDGTDDQRADGEGAEGEGAEADGEGADADGEGADGEWSRARAVGAAARWTWSRAVDGGPAGSDAPTVCATVELDGVRLAAGTNSVERADELAALVGRILPGAALVEDIRVTPDQLRDDGALLADYFDDEDGPGIEGLDMGNLPPEVRAQIWQQIERYEEAWLDDSIPALGGATPREALADPTRRDDLLRLLDHMNEQDAALGPAEDRLGMRVGRLRELLGLPASGVELRLPGR
jgi:hypothetical protein